MIRTYTRTYIDKHGNTSTMSTANIGRSRPEPEPDYPLREDPRQVDIVDAVAAYGRATGDLRGKRGLRALAGYA